MIRKYFSTLIIGILAMPLTLLGQDGEFDPPTIVPPSPVAYELGKYGMVDIGLFTGTVNPSIPLYTFTAGKLSLPISLNYNSNGIKVNQLSSDVGLGWSLNAGGVVTRIVRGKEDENNNVLFPEGDIAEHGIRSPMAVEFFYAAGNHDVDTEPDLYAYNFNGYSGKFAYTRENGIVQFPKKDLEILSYVDASNNRGFLIIDPKGVKYYFLEEEININRLQGSGHSAPDAPATTSWFLTKVQHPSGDEIELVYSNNNYSYTIGQTQSLKSPSPHVQVKSCEGQITNQWDLVESPLMSNNLQVVSKKLLQIKSNNSKNGTIDFFHNVQHPEITSYDLVSKIQVNNESLEEIERFELDYLLTANNRVFLKNVTFKDISKTYELDYVNPEQVPSRLSFSQDHWGFYNGISNSKLYPNPQNLDNFVIHSNLRDYNQGGNKGIDTIKSQYGLLSRIQYPTKGYSEFEYESNSYYGTKKVYPPSISENLTVSTDENSFFDEGIVTLTNILSNQEIELYNFIGFNYVSGCDESNYPTHHIQATINVTDLTDTGANTLTILSNPVGNSISIAADENYDNLKMNLIASHDYEIKIKITKPCLTASLNFNYFTGSIQEVAANIHVGGSRIKRVKKVDPTSNKVAYDTYYYSEKESLHISSGIKGLNPFYISNITSAFNCSGIQNFVNYLSLSSSSIRTLYSNASGTTSYQYVTISKGGDNFENGGEEHQFLVGGDYPGNPLWGEYIESAPWTNAGWDNGLNKKSTVFKKSGSSFIVLNKTENFYVSDTRKYKELLAYSVKKKYELLLSAGTAVYECTSKDVSGGSNSEFKSYKCTAAHSHSYRFNLSPFEIWRPIWNTNWDSNVIVCGRIDANNTENITYHPCYNEAIGDNVAYPDQLRNLDITEYKNISFWHYLDSTSTIQYDQNGLNPIQTSTKYFYDNPDHIQLSRSQTVDSKGSVVESKMYYPQDVSSLSSLPGKDLLTNEKSAIDSLVAQHRINIPLQSETYYNGVDSKKRVVYKDWGQKNGSAAHLIEPQIISSKKGTSVFIDRVLFKEYDGDGNLIEVQKTDGASMYYVWGYNGSKPIAKIMNVETITSAQQTAIDNTIASSNSDTTLASEELLRSALEALRNSFPNAMVTTFTYDPLIGTTSVTNPKGETINYQYDDFNRLQYVKDHDGKIISKNEYHYKN